MSQISLTASMRQNLQSLQNTQGMFDSTQERLSTGKKVNSALDNPGSFFTARSLSQRAGDLNGLMDSMGQSIQTLQAADQGIETLTTFVEQAKALVNSARDSSVKPTTLESTVKISDFATLSAGLSDIDDGEVIRFRIGDGQQIVSSKTFDADATTADMIALGIGNSDTILLRVGDDGKDENLLILDGDEDVQAIVSKIDDLSTDAKAELVDGKIVVTSLSGENIMFDMPVIGESGNSFNAEHDLGLNTAQGEIRYNAGDNADDLVSKINAMVDFNGDSLGVTAELVDGKLKLTAADGQDIMVTDDILTGSSTIAQDLGINFDSTNGSNDRSTYAAQFDDLRTQINELVNDTGYKGVNLLKGDDLTVVFNEGRTSKLNIKGVTFDATGLGINASTNNWKDASDIETALNNVETAITTLRNQATTFGNNLSVVKTRETFTEGMVNTLTSGADKLVLADMNEEAANMLALQTRQQLGTNSLSLASQSAQGVLRLF